MGTHTPNIHTLSGIPTHDHSARASEDSTCLRPLGYRDRHITNYPKYYHVYGGVGRRDEKTGSISDDLISFKNKWQHTAEQDFTDITTLYEPQSNLQRLI
jgi:hypothetical protein